MKSSFDKSCRTCDLHMYFLNSTLSCPSCKNIAHISGEIRYIRYVRYSLSTLIPQLPCNSFPFQSGVTSVTFAKFHPNLIVGGTYSGQIVLWDNRSSKKTPVQRTPLSATAHTVSEFYVNFVFLLWCLDVRAK